MIGFSNLIDTKYYLNGELGQITNISMYKLFTGQLVYFIYNNLLN